MPYHTKHIKVTSSMCYITGEETLHRSPSAEGECNLDNFIGTESLAWK